MGIGVALALGLGLALIIVAVIYGVRHDKKMRAQRVLDFAQFAVEMGFQHTPDGTSEQREGTFWQLLWGGPGSPTQRFVAQFEGFRPFGLGHSPEVRNFLFAEEGCQWLVFDYIYMVTTSNGKTTTTTPHPQSVVALRMNLTLPRLEITPEGAFRGLREAMGIRDLKVESDEFNRRYKVVASEQQGAFDLLHPQMIEFLLSLPPGDWQMAGPYLVRHQAGFVPIAEYRRMLIETREFLELIPGYVRQDRSISAQWGHPLEV